MLSTKLHQKIISVIMIFVTIITISIVFSAETNASSQKYKWRAQYNLVQGNYNTENCYVKLYYKSDNGNGDEGSFIIEGDSEAFDKNKEGYYYWISENSVSVPSGGKRTTVNENLPDNAIPTKLEIYVCCVSSSPGYIDFVMNDIKLEVMNQQGDIIGTSDIGSIYIPSSKEEHSVCTTVSINKDTNNSGPQFPEGYDFKEDRYSFRNSNVADTISLDIYKDVFGEEKGETIYNAYERGESTHGLCYGIAVTTGSLLLDVPSVDSFIRYVGPCKYIKDINMGTKCYELNTITAKNFIKYGYVTQFSTQAETEFGDCTALYNAVSDYVYNGGIPVTVSLKEYRYDSSKNEWSQTFGHRVLAVGIDGNNGIIIDDSNKGSKQTIYLTKDSNGNFTNEWTYSGYSQTTDGTCIFDKNVGVARVIGYNTAIALPYLVLAANAQLDGYPDSAYEDEYHEVDIETKKLDSEYNLVSVISDSYEIVSDDGYLSAIDKPEMGSEINDNNGDLYWINDSSNITVSNFNSNDNKVKFATNDVAVEVSICEDSTVEMSIDENSNSVIANLSIVEGKNYTIAFDTSDSEGNDVDISVTGTANGDEVVACETEDGIQVTGLNDITVTYETADGTAETTAKVDDGSTVNITVNDDENTVETDWQCKHPDENHDGICDSCAEDFTKSCLCSCHSNAFMQFLHKILCFLYRIFGMEQYRYCGCGKAHW